MDTLNLVLVSSLTINNARIEKYCISHFTLYIFTGYLIYNVKIHGSRAKKKNWVTFRKVIQAHKIQPPRPPDRRPRTTSLRCGLVAGLGVVTSVAPGCRRGGNAVVLDGMQLRLSTYMGGTSSWAQPCSWTQKQLSIKERHPAFTVHAVKGGWV